MAATSEPVCDIAGMGAVLAVPVAVCREGFNAVGAGEGIDGCLSSLHSILVLVPPFLTALAGTELYRLDAGFLMDRLAAVLAEDSVRNGCSWISDFSIQTVSVAIGNNLILGKAKSSSDFLIAEPLHAKF